MVLNPVGKLRVCTHISALAASYPMHTADIFDNATTVRHGCGFFFAARKLDAFAQRIFVATTGQPS